MQARKKTKSSGKQAQSIIKDSQFALVKKAEERVRVKRRNKRS